MTSDSFFTGGEAVECYFSALARESELAELVARFVADLPARVAEMRQAADAENWTEVGRLAHQLKGAGGSYGFGLISVAAGGVERGAREGLATGVSVALSHLDSECRRARAGVQQESSGSSGNGEGVGSRLR